MPKIAYLMPSPLKYPNWAAFEAELAVLSELGYQGVELHLGDPDQVDADRLLNTLDRHDLRMCSIATGSSYFQDGLCFSSADPSIRTRAVRRVEAYLSFAAPFQAQIVIGQMQGFKTDEPDRNTYNARVVECLQEASSQAAKLGTMLFLEPINRFELGYNHTTIEVLELIDRISSPALTVMLDTFHINIEENSLDGPVFLAGSRLGHVHLWDNHRGLVGTGHLDLESILRATLAVDYQGWWAFGDFSANPLSMRAGAAIDFLERTGLNLHVRQVN